MRNLRILIEYEGTRFYGWQYQPNMRTVQGEIETALKKVFNEAIKIIGAGRTDQGVHAFGQVANFHTDSHLELRQIKKGVNSLIGDDVHIRNIDEVDNAFHSRNDAKSKIYQYHITLVPSPFKLRYAWFVKHNIDAPAMQKAISEILGKHDFKNFSVHDGGDNTFCDIFNMNLTHEQTQIIISIEGDRFLRKMIRGIVGFLIDIGRSRFSAQEIKEVFNGVKKDIYFAPPQGLFLREVKY